jgi:hypothetical protein
MSRKYWIIAGVLAAFFAVMLIIGLYHGDAASVLKNAQNFCFS